MPTLVLIGSGEYTRAMDETDSHLLSMTKNQRVALLPTAAGKEHDALKWLEGGKQHFTRLGAKPLAIPVLNKKDANRNDYASKINDAEIIYFSGGNPGYLLETLQDSIVWEAIKKSYLEGTVLAGSSAGAMIMGNMVLANAQELFDTGGVPLWKKAFGLVDFPIIPHYDFAKSKKPEVIEKALSISPKEVKQNWVGIDEETSLIFTETKAAVMGKGYVHVFGSGEAQYKREENPPLHINL